MNATGTVIHNKGEEEVTRWENQVILNVEEKPNHWVGTWANAKVVAVSLEAGIWIYDEPGEEESA